MMAAMRSRQTVSWWFLGCTAVAFIGCGGGGGAQPGPAQPGVDVSESCASGIDEDGDGKVDCDDEDCATDTACRPAGEDCTNGIDDDGNGRTDCEDDECSMAPTCQEPGGA